VRGGSAILVLFGLIPKMSVVVASVPQFVLGCAGIVMFGMVMATGITILAKVDYSKLKPYNLYKLYELLSEGRILSISCGQP
jgi:uric acid transporter